MLAFVPAVVVSRRRSIAFSAGVELTPAWRRRNSAIKYGGLVLTVVGALAALGAMGWVLPANLC